MEKNERTQYFVADEGTLSYLATKVRKLNEHFVGLENETGIENRWITGSIKRTGRTPGGKHGKICYCCVTTTIIKC